MLNANSQLVSDRSRPWLPKLSLAVLVLLTCCLIRPSAAVAAEETKDLPSKVAALVTQLGDDQFALRERAQAELEKLGLPVYELLLPALKHRDPEVVSRVNRLISRLRQLAAEQLNSSRSREELSRYFQLSEEERRQLLLRNANLSDPDTIAVFCRIVQFEANEELAKIAAIHLMTVNPKFPQQLTDRKQRLGEYFAAPTRAASQWLKYFAATMEPGESIQQWEAYYAAERKLYDQSARPEQKLLLRVFTRFILVQANQVKALDRAAVLFQQLLDWEQLDSQTVPPLVEWIVQHEAWHLLPVLQQRYPELSKSQDPRVVYLLAEVAWKNNRKDEAEELAKTASAIQPEFAEGHLQTMLLLRRRGMLQWVERECQVILAIPQQTQGVAGFQALLILGELQSDQERYQEAAEVFEKCSKLLRRNEDINNQFGNREQFGSNSIQNKQAFNAGMAAAKAGDQDKALIEFRRALAIDEDDADALIALFRLTKGSDKDRQAIEIQLTKVINQFDEQIASDPNDSKALNQYAWLVANTKGDFKLALQRSQKSLELIPGRAGLMDTLAHCHFALGEYAEAVKVQQQAVELEPDSLTMKRALVRFEAALAKSPTTPAKSE